MVIQGGDTRFREGRNLKSERVEGREAAVQVKTVERERGGYLNKRRAICTRRNGKENVILTWSKKKRHEWESPRKEGKKRVQGDVDDSTAINRGKLETKAPALYIEGLCNQEMAIAKRRAGVTSTSSHISPEW